jgi:hypothetical protein
LYVQDKRKRKIDGPENGAFFNPAIMKTLGIVTLVLGIIIMGFASWDFIHKKKLGTEESVEGEPLPFPWKPTAGALCVAGGIIMISASRDKRGL